MFSLLDGRENIVRTRNCIALECKQDMIQEICDPISSSKNLFSSSSLVFMLTRQTCTHPESIDYLKLAYEKHKHCSALCFLVPAYKVDDASGSTFQL